MADHLIDLIPQLANQRVVVVGDVILDEYLIGNATRMSREAPIPVLEFESQRLIPGGAANPAANITALDSHASQIGVIGADDSADQIREVLAARNIEARGLVIDPHRPTTVKTRIMAQMGLRFPQQVARLDRLSRKPISAEIERKVRASLERELPEASAILVSDYQAGLLTPSLVRAICANADGRTLAADAQGELAKYAGFTVVKCNASEARTFLQRDLVTDADFERAALELKESLDLSGGMVITRGASGLTLATKDDVVVLCPAPSVTDVFDTVGAGDTTIAVLTLAIVAGANYADAAALANYASGLVVRRVGNYTPTPQELAWAVKTWGE